MKIIEKMYASAYEYGKKIYNKKLIKEEAAELVNLETGMDKNSAIFYIEQVIGLITGTEYRYFTSEEATDYYIYKIKEDYGIEGIRNCLKAIEYHIEWQEKKSKNIPKYLYVVVDDLKNNIISMWESSSDEKE
ncbi:MAG: hypothetical protein PHO63_05925 [Bacilli bacterium]|nr:hypothetical protein [Bacilli bacterium]